jgi:hypothetical protein
MPLRRSNCYAIYRMDHDGSSTHSWLVRLQRRGRIYHRQFSDHVHGGKRKALEAAKAYRDHLDLALPPLTRQEVCSIKKKNNRSGISGVMRVDVLEKKRGRLYRRVYWDVQWPIGNGKARHKKFSVKKYGERHAFRLAVKARRAALRNLDGSFRSDHDSRECLS